MFKCGSFFMYLKNCEDAQMRVGACGRPSGQPKKVLSIVLRALHTQYVEHPSLPCSASWVVSLNWRFNDVRVDIVGRYV